ncbi:MAG: YbaB/EbfC family nucleoid-associated protein [Microbacteriaceae bacterium]
MDVAALRQSAAELRERAQSLKESAAGLSDAQGTATDESGVATATVRVNGELIALTIANTWRTTIDATQLGPVVFAAMRDAREDLMRQWEESVTAGDVGPVAPAEEVAERVIRSTSTASMDELTARISLINAALDEQDAYTAAVVAGDLVDTFPSPAGYFTVHTASAKVTALEPDDYRLTFASEHEVAADIVSSFALAAERSGSQSETRDARFPSIAELQRNLAQQP